MESEWAGKNVKKKNCFIFIECAHFFEVLGVILFWISCEEEDDDIDPK
jgi:hypothetical protein